MRRVLFLTLVTGLALASFGCGETVETPDDTTANGGGKGDTPGDDASRDAGQLCEDRRDDALLGNRELFGTDFIRWSCADVSGVNTNNKDSRGQEYCEYFALVNPPPETEGGEFGEAVDLGRPTGDEEGDVTALSLDLTDDQIFWLEDHPQDVIGECVFTSWHSDVPGPVPACEGTATECPQVRGVPVDEDVFRMKVFFNSNSAAYALVEECLGAAIDQDYVVADDLTDPEDPLNGGFYRGCMLAYLLYGTEWRKSDSSICAAAVRLAECGCVDDPSAAAAALVPPVESGQMRGFPLGGWADRAELPPGCDYVELGDASQTLVTCDLTATDVLRSRSDLKGACRQKYADSVVVYVPLPDDGFACEAPEDGLYSDSCGPTPWVVTQ